MGTSPGYASRYISQQLQAEIENSPVECSCRLLFEQWGHIHKARGKGIAMEYHCFVLIISLERMDRQELLLCSRISRILTIPYR